MPPIRIVELRSTYRDGGGPDKTILLSAQAHDRSRYDVRCVYLRGADDHAFSLGRRARALEVPFQEILEGGKVDPGALFRLGRCIRSHRPHIVHTHDYKSDILGRLLHFLFPKAALLATAHGWTLDNRRMDLYNQLDRRILRHFHHVIAVSGATRGRLIDAGLDPSRISILYNGIDVAVWRPGPHERAAAALKLELSIPSSARLLGFIGRLSPEKDAATAMEVARRVIQAEPDTHVIVIGDGAAEGELPNRIQSLGISDKVHLLGYRAVDSSLYHALDVYYMTSRTEGLPNTLLEAMASGRPSVVTAVGGIPELLGSSGAAIQCQPGDVGALTEGLLALLRDRQRAETMGAAARERIVNSFSFTERLRQIEAIYDRLAADAG